MSKVLVNDTDLSGTASAIRRKNGVSTLYKPSEMAAAVDAIPTGITPTGTKNITENGTTDVTQYASANVNVPNSYSASDEGKVVSNGALVAQTAHSKVTQNGTYDTTNNNTIEVDVSGGGGSILVSKTITQNGTYDPADDNADGYSEVTVNVSGGGSPVIYNNDRTLAVYLDQTNNRIVWYFMGFEKTASDAQIPPEMILSQSGLMYSKAYGSDKETQIGQIGFYGGNIRSWSINTAQLIAGTFWGVVYSNGGEGQTNPYTDPPQ